MWLRTPDTLLQTETCLFQNGSLTLYLICHIPILSKIHFSRFFLKKSLCHQGLFVTLRHENPPSLSTMLKCAGRFCFYRFMATRIPFIKTYSTPKELVHLLKTRGMEITDEEKAEHYLSHIGYYRLSAYMHPLLSIPKEQHLFKQGTTFRSCLNFNLGFCKA